VSGRIAVGVSGTGSNLFALLLRESWGRLGGHVSLVFADRPCPAIETAGAEPYEIPTLLLTELGSSDPTERAAADRALATALREARIDLVVLAGYMRIVGPAVLEAFAGRILNTHPSLLPAFPGGHAVRDALAHGAVVTGVTIHLVDETLDGGPILFQEPIAVLTDDTEATLHARLKQVEHRLLPRAVSLLLGGAVSVEPGGRRVRIDAAKVDAAVPKARLALLSVSDKTGLVPFADGLLRLGFELVASGGTAGRLKAAALPVTDVSAVTGFPEMLDGRVKTVHPRIHAGILADRRRADHREALIAAAIDPFEVVAVNLYPFEETARQPGIELDEIIEQIDIGGPALVRAAAKNHRGGVTVVTSPDRYDELLGALGRDHGAPDQLRAGLALEAFRHTAAYDAAIAAELGRQVERDGTGGDGASEGSARWPATLRLQAERMSELRYGENPHQGAALYHLPDAPAEAGPFAVGIDLRQGKPLSYNNILDAAAAAALARDLRGPGCVIVKHTNPCGVAERADLLAAWDEARAGDPVSAFGGVVALTGPIDGPLAERLTSLFLEVVVAPDVTPAALVVLAHKPNLRVVVDAGLGRPPVPSTVYRSAGGALLAADADTAPDDPSSWRQATRRGPTEAEREDLELAWRICRHVTSNAIVLVRERALVGVGAGQMSRVDSARLAVAKAGPERARGATCASDAFYPFPDGVEVCTTAGVMAFVQPGGSQRDEEVVAAADAAGATMLLTGVRHFRH
jgi:phosphoribosylaminoimidazolecarboxamide formyltransferase/IMP cyclohydrolase